MDNQCDKCGGELPASVLYPDAVIGSHAAFGPVHYFSAGNTEWDPEDEYTFCPTCIKEFSELWEKWYGAPK